MKNLLPPLALIALGLTVANIAISQTAPPPTKPTHAILFYETPQAFAARTGPEAKSYWASWGPYIEGIRASGKLMGGSALEDPKLGLVTPVATAVKGPRLSGYLVLDATLDEAQALAKASPSIAAGGYVEVRPLLAMGPGMRP